MSWRAAWDGMASAFRGDQFKPTVILLVAPVLMITWKYYGDAKFLARAIPDACVLWSDRAASGAVYSFVLGFALLAVVPALVVRFGLRERLADYGVRIGIPARTWRSMLMMCPCLVLAGYIASLEPSVQAQYPINPSAGRSPGIFAIHIATYLLFYLGWEFHFRGFLQMGIRDKLGDVNAVLVQVLASGIMHIGRPASETYASLAAGLFWGFLAIRTRSLLSGLIQHYALGVSLDWFLCYNR